MSRAVSLLLTVALVVAAGAVPAFADGKQDERTQAVAKVKGRISRAAAKGAKVAVISDN